MPPSDATPAPDGQLDYIRRLLRGARDPGAADEFLYATRTEGKAGFWELLGFRVAGLSRALVGAAHFQAQSDDPLVFARRSLGHFLSSPPQAVAIDRATYPADLVEVRVPRAEESLPDLLGRLRHGQPTVDLYLDAGLVEVAYDFRPQNPSLQRPRSAASAQRLLFRTREGHVLSGEAANLSARLRRGGAFLVLTGAEQILPDRTLRLPTIVVHRDFLTMVAEVPDGGSDPAAALPAPLAPETANPFHLLDPRLST